MPVFRIVEVELIRGEEGRGYSITAEDIIADTMETAESYSRNLWLQAKMSGSYGIYPLYIEDKRNKKTVLNFYQELPDVIRAIYRENARWE